MTFLDRWKDIRSRMNEICGRDEERSHGVTEVTARPRPCVIYDLLVHSNTRGGTLRLIYVYKRSRCLRCNRISVCCDREWANDSDRVVVGRNSRRVLLLVIRSVVGRSVVLIGYYSCGYCTWWLMAVFIVRTFMRHVLVLSHHSLNVKTLSTISIQSIIDIINVSVDFYAAPPARWFLKSQWASRQGIRLLIGIRYHQP